jgi:hypothetical protein
MAADVERLSPWMNTVTTAVTNRCAEGFAYTHCQPRCLAGLLPSACRWGRRFHPRRPPAARERSPVPLSAAGPRLRSIAGGLWRLPHD